jgi:hypothetical protein
LRYTDCYGKAAKSKQIRMAWIGCGIQQLAILVFLVASITAGLNKEEEVYSR